MKAIAKALKSEDKKTNTDAVIGRKLGVARETVRDWFISNGGTAVANNRKSSVKINPKEAPVILDRVEGGEPQEQVAADYGVTQGRISQMATKEKKQREAKKERQKAVAK